jgi:hypothetical protein
MAESKINSLDWPSLINIITKSYIVLTWKIKGLFIIVFHKCFFKYFLNIFIYLNFYLFLYYFNMLILKTNLKILKIYYFNIPLNKKYFLKIIITEISDFKAAVFHNDKLIT